MKGGVNVEPLAAFSSLVSFHLSNFLFVGIRTKSEGYMQVVQHILHIDAGEKDSFVYGPMRNKHVKASSDSFRSVLPGNALYAMVASAGNVAIVLMTMSFYEQKNNLKLVRLAKVVI